MLELRKDLPVLEPKKDLTMLEIRKDLPVLEPKKDLTMLELRKDLPVFEPKKKGPDNVRTQEGPASVRAPKRT
ncbi:hypothetical protein BgiMline_012178 [Biomphalaria glabrata]|nr:hypothetical protein BgiMline_030740 [Biomphalaria glabrata]